MQYSYEDKSFRNVGSLGYDPFLTMPIPAFWLVEISWPKTDSLRLQVGAINFQFSSKFVQIGKIILIETTYKNLIKT